MIQVFISKEVEKVKLKLNEKIEEVVTFLDSYNNSIRKKSAHLKWGEVKNYHLANKCYFLK